MPSLKDLKNRINSVKSTRKITSAMKMVAAAKLKRAQEHAEAARPYAERFDAVMANLARAAKDSPTAPVLLTGTGKSAVKLFIVATAERGLCGGFNGSIVRRARTDIDAHVKEGGTAKILTIGRKGRDILRRDYRQHLVGHIDLSEVKRVGYANAAEIAQEVLGRRGQFRLGVAVRGRRIAVHGAEVALAGDQRLAHHPGLRHAHQGVVDRLVAVRVVLAHHVADDAGTLHRPAGRVEVQLVVHGVHDPALHGLQPVPHVGQRPGLDHRHRVSQVPLTSLLRDRYRVDRLRHPGGSQSILNKFQL